MINGGTGTISSNVVTDVLTDSNKMIFKTNTFPLSSFKSQTLVIASQDKSMLSSNRIVRMWSDTENSRIYHGRIGTPIVNKNIWSVYDNFNVRSDVGEADKLYIIVQQSLTNERNTASPQIKEESLESVFSKIVEESNLGERMNLANSLSIEIPKIVHLGHPPMEKNNVGNLIDGIVATIIENSNRIWRRTDKDDSMAHTHDIETISEKIAYRNHIRNLEIETGKVFERETSNENIENIVTRLDKTRLDNNQMTRSTDSSKHRKTHKP